MTRLSKPFAQSATRTSSSGRSSTRAVIVLLLALSSASATRAQLPAAPSQAPPPAPTLQPTLEPIPTAPGAIGPTGAGSTITSFDIVVRAPPQFSDVREVVERHNELQRYRAVTDLDGSELARLIVLAEGNVRNLVGTLGYFSPEIRITQEGGANQRLVIVIAIEPGEPSVTGAVKVDFLGDIAQTSDADAISQREGIRRDWRLPTGRTFTQGAWDSAKTQALRDLVVRRYPAGKLDTSLADIDAPNRTAGLSLTLDSGPLYRLGKLQVTGVERYDAVLVPRLARLPEGSVYDQRRLIEAQQRLASSGYFDSAYVFVDPDSDPAAAPIQVQVREAKLQKIVLGVGITTDSGPRASVEHTHHRVPGVGWRAATKLQLEKKAPFAQTEWMSVPDEASWRWVTLARAERLEDDELITRGQRLRFGRTQAGDRIDRSIYLQYDRAQVQGAGLGVNSAAQAGDGSALSANYVWTGRYFDSLPFPSQGYGLGFELGGGTTLGQNRQPYTRTVGRWLGIKSLPRGRIAMRAEGGAVLAKESAAIPGTQLFRSGGDSTVRGYGYRDIGIKLANGVIGPGRYLAVGSVEWQRPILRGGLPSEWEHTLFVDAGAVDDRPQELRASVGVGTGVRWRSPIGPLQADVAYGVKAKQLRLHLSVGFVF